ncbi:hypothetical protein [uncultured Methanolobus sp.]|uniref:hypothetical protein n=1 Tax=uncultured Methanolobus sp. TaxID=218300 RepID=UPI0029C703D8|nr:hypothetical protein [uncultured Methanolobus sp.]
MPRIKGWKKINNLSWKSDWNAILQVDEKYTGNGYGYEFTIKMGKDLIAKTQDKDIARAIAVEYMRRNPGKV